MSELKLHIGTDVQVSLIQYILKHDRIFFILKVCMKRKMIEKEETLLKIAYNMNLVIMFCCCCFYHKYLELCLHQCCQQEDYAKIQQQICQFIAKQCDISVICYVYH